MATKTTKQLNTTVSAETFEAINDYRFENRIDKLGDVLKLALDEFIENHGITVPAEAVASE